MSHINAAAFGRDVVFLYAGERPPEAGIVQLPEQQGGNAHAAPNQIVEVDALPDLHSENLGPRDAENAVGPAGQPSGVIGQRNTHNFHNADGHNQQIIAAQVNNGPRNHQGEQRGAGPRHGQQPQHRNAETGIQNGRDIRAHGVERRMPHIENSGLAKDDIERK